MSLGLQATKRRINSVNSTKKITKAMELVATAKLKMYKDKLSISRQYAEEITSLIKRVMLSISPEHYKDFSEQFESKSENDLYIVITSSLGLCGGYNYNLFKELFAQKNDGDQIAIIGLKGETFLRNRKIEADTQFVNLLSNFDYSAVRKLSNYTLSAYRSKKYRKIKIIYTKFKNSITFVPQTETLFPVELDKIEKEDLPFQELNMLIEPNPQEVLEEIIPLYLRSTIHGRLVESLVSEQSSRRNAMESATDNASEIVDQLLLDYNKARQSSITQEITEVVSGANAAK